MTDAPSQRPPEPAAPGSADTDAPNKHPTIPGQATTPVPGAAEAPQRSYARVDVPGAEHPPTWHNPALGWNTAPRRGQLPPAPVPGWEWSGSWVPRPGVIPLRPLSVGEIISGAFAVLRRYWRATLAISACVALVSQAGITVVSSALSQQMDALNNTFSANGGSPADMRQALASLGDAGYVLGLRSLIGLTAGTCAAALLSVVVSRAVLGKPATLSDVWTETRPRLLQMLGTALMVSFIVGGAVALSAAPALIAHAAGSSDVTVSNLTLLVLPGLLAATWLYITLSLATPALVLERQGIRASLSRSARLVRRAWWRIFGITLLVGFLVLIASILVDLPLAFAQVVTTVGSSGSVTATSSSTLLPDAIGGFISAALTLPLTASACVLLYIDQRIRREALDLELATAAGVPNYGESTRRS
ncbi:hypothetical protein ABIA33_003769 [Streptacidiphilus sp. MAP12-16]|uniref:hypothetical protein n=1 Tax=Streptacidiphilus sp. MAP12-16 TaxID=3156300 RepID=UPI0035116ADD